MNTKKLFSYTLKVSVIVQFATLAINLLVSTKNIPREYYIIKDLFFLELFVQIIEGLFYIWLAYNFNKLRNITPNRYMDWVLTTPTMLITLISYLIFFVIFSISVYNAFIKLIFASSNSKSLGQS